MNEQELDIVELLISIKENIHKIILSTLLFGMCFFAFNKFFVSPSYETSSKIMTQKKIDSNMGSSYANLAKTDLFASKVIEDLDLDMSVATFANNVSVDYMDNTRIISITVTDTNPERAMDLTNQTTAELISTIRKLNKNKDKAFAIDKASLPKEPASPNLKKKTAIGLVLGFFVGLMWQTIAYVCDTRIKKAKDLKKISNLPILGIIPKNEKEK